VVREAAGQGGPLAAESVEGIQTGATIGIVDVLNVTPGTAELCGNNREKSGRLVHFRLKASSSVTLALDYYQNRKHSVSLVLML
jgi:hypothetical protein